MSTIHNAGNPVNIKDMVKYVYQNFPSISAPFLQRKLKINYKQAKGICDSVNALRGYRG